MKSKSVVIPKLDVRFLLTLAKKLVGIRPRLVGLSSFTITKINIVRDGILHDYRADILAENESKAVVEIHWEHIDPCDWIPVLEAKPLKAK